MRQRRRLFAGMLSFWVRMRHRQLLHRRVDGDRKGTETGTEGFCSEFCKLQLMADMFLDVTCRGRANDGLTFELRVEFPNRLAFDAV